MVGSNHSPDQLVDFNRYKLDSKVLHGRGPKGGGHYLGTNPKYSRNFLMNTLPLIPIWNHISTRLIKSASIVLDTLKLEQVRAIWLRRSADMTTALALELPSLDI